MKLGLGTVQFGLNYGVSNRSGIVAPSEVKNVLACAAKSGAVGYLDTATAYGSAEEVLGATLEQRHPFKIVTKTPTFKDSLISSESADELERSFRKSLLRLNQTAVYGLLAHHASPLLDRDGAFLFDRMLKLKEQGVVKKIGVSVYSAEEIDRVIERYPVELIQAPVSLLDQRLVTGGHLARLNERGIEVHARSVFLQGLLLMEADNIPRNLASIQEHLGNLRAEVEARGLTMLQAALGFVLNLEAVTACLVGVCSLSELNQILEAARLAQEKKFEISGVAASAAWDDERVLNPFFWEKYA
ncbi:MAG: aldo/keto reductase [Bdellovibrionota bacterium]